MDASLLDVLDVPFAVLESDGDTVRWTNACCRRWLPMIEIGESLKKLVPAFASRRAERGLQANRNHSVSARAPDSRGRDCSVEFRRRPLEWQGESLWLLEGLDRSKAEVKQQLLDSYAKTIETNNSILADNEQALEKQSAQMRRLLDNMQDGMFVVDRDGAVGAERSAMCGQWFGSCKVIDAATYLGNFDDNAGAWFEVSFAAVLEGFLPLEFTLAQLPTKMENDGVHLSLSYVPITTDGVLDHLLVIASNITSLTESEQAKRREQDVLELTRRLLRDRAGLEQFVAEIDSMLSVLQGGELALEDALRQLHTIKGNCALFGADALSALVHELEAEVIETRTTPSRDRIDLLASAWETLVGPIRRMVRIDDRSVVELSDSELANFITAIDQAKSNRDVKAIALSWRNPPVRNMLSILGEQAAGIGARLGKEVDVVIHDNEMRLPLKPWRSYWSAMTHVVRNAVDHGIELGEERAAAGKPARGLVVFETYVEDGAVIVRVRDDGAGIDWQRVADNRRARLGDDADVSDDALREELFRSGFSTREQASELSGRGVGLGAAVAECRALGGDIVIKSKRGEGTVFEFVFSDAQLSELAQASQMLTRPPESGLFVASETRPCPVVTVGAAH